MCAWLLAFVAFYLLPLMTHGLWIPDETRYAQISQEMLLSGNWVSPHFMGIRYFEKPIAGYWMIAIGQAVFGDNLFGVRIASALSTGLSVWLVYLISPPVLERSAQKFCLRAVLHEFRADCRPGRLRQPRPAVYALGQLEPGLAVVCHRQSHERGRLGAWALLGFACGMGFMTKGFLAWLLPALIALPYMLWQRRFRNCCATAHWRCSLRSSCACPGCLPSTIRNRISGTSSSGTNTCAGSPPIMHNTLVPGGSTCR